MNLFKKLIKAVVGDENEKSLKSFYPIVESINKLEDEIKSLSDDELKGKTSEFKKRLSKNETLDDILPEAFAVVREASLRVLQMRHFDVQLIGGIALHQGQIAEMKTGEGKTLGSTLPAYLNALEQKGVYIVTVNDYLAKRDSEWMGRLYSFLGLSVGLIQSNMEQRDRLAAYNCDITYGTNNEYGFDYLRDNLCQEIEQCCQVRRHYAIVDEVDSILIDEARTPLIISGPVNQSTELYLDIAKIVHDLENVRDFTVDEKHKNVVLTEEGVEAVEGLLGLKDLFSLESMEHAHILLQSLKALYLFKKDVDYVVNDGNVVIVDEFTGRLMDGRRYSDGLHQAIEAIEGLDIKEESQTLASITFQNYFRMFPKLSGMTGTAVTEKEEFGRIYGLPVLSIPTNKPLVRDDQQDVIFKSQIEKYKAIVTEIKTRHKKGQPILVGTISIENSELLSTLLKRDNIPHRVLNAKHHEKEAEIVANAGQKDMVTIATNMAGRGTDIVLGDGVKDLGGLCILGTERHESRRIDNQLRGRSGRQGDPGFSKFYVSLEDSLMRLFGSEKIIRIMERLGVPEDTPIEHPIISRSNEKAQKKVEAHHFSIRKQVLQYDDVLNKQRETVYGIRNLVLRKFEFDKRVQEMISDVVNQKVDDYLIEEGGKIRLTDDLVSNFVNSLTQIFSIGGLDELLKKIEKKDLIKEEYSNLFFDFYKKRRSEYPIEIFEEVSKRVLLSSLDRKWTDHLHNMDVLREGINLRAWGQKDPLLEYKMEAFDMFSELLVSVWEEALSIICKLNIQIESPVEVQERKTLSYNKVLNEPGKPVVNDSKLGRNESCSCGSGRKYKKCCMNLKKA
jgi:preprotein translocase subunit SecA